MTLRKLQILGEKEIAKIIVSARKEKTLAKCFLCKKSKIELFFVNAKKMTALNQSYRGIRRPTDILSFPTPKQFHRVGILGSLIVCVPVLKQQANEHVHPIPHELRILLIHGILHLLGFDHESGHASAVTMRRHESRLLKIKNGIGLIQRSSMKYK